MEILKQLMNKQPLTKEQARDMMENIMEKKYTDAQTAALLIALESKGVAAEELAEFVHVLKSYANKIAPNTLRGENGSEKQFLIDTCGTGGDGSNTFNISTTSAIVLAACNISVAKHGNRSVSSACGSADILEALGINISLTPEQVQQCIEQVGIGFLFAPTFHPAFKNIGQVRKELGVRTVFNILGPLLNPAPVDGQVIGVFKPELIDLYSQTLLKQGIKNAMVVHGNGLDEIALHTQTTISHIKDGQIKKRTITPEEVGLTTCELKELQSDSIEQNIQIIKELLDGKDSPKKDVVLLNAAAGLIVAQKANSFQEGIEIAKQAIDSGKAKEKLQQLVEFTNNVR